MHLLRCCVLWLALLGSAFSMVGGGPKRPPPAPNTAGRLLAPQPQSPPHQRQRLNNDEPPSLSEQQQASFSLCMQQMMMRASLAPPWANPVFLKQPVEEQLKQAVSWFFDALDNRIIKPK